jgi:hypothetical protein
MQHVPNQAYHYPIRPYQTVSGNFIVNLPLTLLAYELEIPSNWRIHPVISVTHLELAPRGKDSYNRKGNDHLSLSKKAILMLSNENSRLVPFLPL